MVQLAMKLAKLLHVFQKFAESPEGQKLLADLKEMGHELLEDLKVLKEDVEDVKEALSDDDAEKK